MQSYLKGIIFTFLGSVSMSISPTLVGQSRGEMPEKAKRYTEGIGVNIHMRFINTVYYTAFDKIIYPKLKELGIKHVRDGVPYTSFLRPVDTALIKNRMIKLYDSLGIKYCFATDSKKVVDSLEFRDSAQYLNVFLTSEKLRKSIQYLEGFNEPDLTIFGWYPANWETLTYAVQKGLWIKAHSMPALANIPIVNTSLVAYWTNPSKPGKVGAIQPHISNYFDLANFHTYDSGDESWKMFPASWYDLSKRFFDTIQKKKPWVVTEFGYENALNFNVPSEPKYQPHTYHYISELSMGKYLSFAYMEYFKRGAEKAYLYEFIDQQTTNEDDKEMNFGLLHTDGSPKPAYNVLKNMFTIMKDDDTDFSPQPLSYEITGDTAGIKNSLFQKSNGVYYLALWQGLSKGVNYDYKSYTDLPADSQRVKLSLPFAAKVNVYQPLISASPIYVSNDKNALDLNVPDHLLMLEIIPDNLKGKLK